MKAVLSEYSQRKKIKYFIEKIPKNASILEIGSGDGALSKYLKAGGWKNYIGLDIVAPADIVGDIKEWKKLGLKNNSFDVIIGFEVLEHVDFLKEALDLLKPGGLLYLTSPYPTTDWVCQILEFVKLSQKRSSKHTNLTYFKNIRGFDVINIKSVGLFAQWGIFKKPFSS